MTQKLEILLDMGPIIGMLMIIFLIMASIAIPTLILTAQRSAEAKERMCRTLERIQSELTSAIKKRQA